MVNVVVQGDRVRFEVEGWDKRWALKSQLEIPLAHIRSARWDPEPARGWWHGARLPGTQIPGIPEGRVIRGGDEPVFDPQLIITRTDTVLVWRARVTRARRFEGRIRIGNLSSDSGKTISSRGAVDQFLYAGESLGAAYVVGAEPSSAQQNGNIEVYRLRHGDVALIGLRTNGFEGQIATVVDNHRLFITGPIHGAGTTAPVLSSELLTIDLQCARRR